MALIKTCRGNKPLIHDSCWLAENATVIGDVHLAEGCSVWFNAVIRGDVNSIRLGKHCNIQDGAVLHCTYEKSTTVLGDYVSVGHNAIVHGCKISSNVLIGMGAIVMDHVDVPENVIVAAGAVALENQKLEANSIYAGVPAKRIKALPEKLRKGEIQRIAKNYGVYSSWFSSSKK